MVAEAASLLWTAIRCEPRSFMAAVATGTAHGILTVLAAQVIGAVTEQTILPAFHQGDTTLAAVVTGALLLFAVTLGRALALVGRRFWSGIMQARLQAEYRRRVSHQYVHLPLSWRQRHSTGALLSTVGSDIDTAWNPIAPLPAAISVLVMLTTAVGAAFATDVAFGLVCILMVSAIVAMNVVYQRIQRREADDVQNVAADVSAVAHESIDGALTVKTLHAAEREEYRLRGRSERLRDAHIRLGRGQALFDSAFDLFPALGVIAVLLVGSIRIESASLGAGDLVEVAYLFTLLSYPTRTIGGFLAALPRSLAGWRRVSQVLAFPVAAAPPENDECASSSIDTRGPLRLEVQALRFGHGRSEILNDVSFEAAAGSTVAVVGPTGAGKSTLLSLLAQLDEPAYGEVLLNGVNARCINRAQFVTAVAIVPQDPFLFMDSVRENLTLGLDADDAEIWRALRGAQADQFVRDLPEGLDTRLGERGTRLSGGQRQRLALARALIRRPGLLLVDDVTSSLDPVVESRVLDGLCDTLSECTIVAVTHHRATLSRADTVVFLEQGRVIAIGTHEQLWDEFGRYRTLVTAHEESETDPVGESSQNVQAHHYPAADVGRQSVHGGSTREGGEAGTWARSERGMWSTILRGLQFAPGFWRTVPLTILLAVLATVGRVAIPAAVQNIIDHGVRVPNGPDLEQVQHGAGIAALVILVTTVAGYLMSARLCRATAEALSSLRLAAFRHIHRLSILQQAAHRRGVLVGNLTTDVDAASHFIQGGGLLLLVSAGQIAVATALMMYYSWQLTLVAWACFVPLVIILRGLQTAFRRAYERSRDGIAAILASVSEVMAGLAVVRAHGAERRTLDHIVRTIGDHEHILRRLQFLGSVRFVSAETTAGLATAAVMTLGVFLGVGGGITLGELLAFLFLLQLFVMPFQAGTEVLNQAYNAVAGWRRVLAVLDVVPDVGDPGESGRTMPCGPLSVRLNQVTYAYPGGQPVLHEVDLEIPAGSRIAVVGETGSGKSTFVKVLARLIEPTHGRVLLSGVDARNIGSDALNNRVLMVPQDGFLFDTSIAENVRYARPNAIDDEIAVAFAELGLKDWLESLPEGMATMAGQQGGNFSAGERQFVILARALLADPDLLILDEATSAIDPGTDARLQQALRRLTHGRTAIIVAHRMATAATADEIVVFAGGRVVQRGPHEDLLVAGGPYAVLCASAQA
ncbi:ABC transporter ATP-binding protein [Nonomuraea sp. NPDC049625]|uniref:ABC transporter ATP-binding protein n=1 Tax=Nonomuraea sp. NPDC049625 TaxID=3155775 RepID=UPI00342AFB71